VNNSVPIGFPSPTVQGAKLFAPVCSSAQLQQIRDLVAVGKIVILLTKKVDLI